MNGKKISLIIPFYNSSNYVEQLFAQFADQPMENVELICIDDGSRDDTWEKLKKKADEVAYSVILYHQENQGVSAARNRGLELAQGEYIAFLDSDDAVAKNYMAILLSYAEQNVNVLVFASRRVDVDFTREECPFVQSETLTATQMLNEFWADPTKLGVNNLLVKKSFLEDRGVTYAVGYKYYEDYDMLLQLFAQTERILVTKQVLYYYIMQENSAMGQFNAERINCLKLMTERRMWLRTVAPDFAPTFDKWGTSRLYWSVLWQAALALPVYRDFARFAEATSARAYFKKLRGYPDRLLQLSTAVFLMSPRAYHAAVRLMGRKKSKVRPTDLQTLLQALNDDVAFY